MDILDSLKSGVVSSITGTPTSAAIKFIGVGLKKLIGFNENTDREDLIAWMQGVSKELSFMEDQLSDLQKQLSSSSLEIITNEYWSHYKQQYDTYVSSWKEIINVSFDKYQDICNDFTKRAEKLPPESASDYKTANEQFHQDLTAAINGLELYVKNNGLETKLLSLADFWGRDPFPTSTNLLESWTDTCIISMEANPENVLFYYQNLELNCKIGLQALFLGYTVLTNLKTYKTPSNEADEVTASWLDKTTRNVFQPIMESFMSCSQRLVLASYRPDSASRTTTITPIETIFKIGERSHLLNWLVLSILDENDTPGIMVQSFDSAAYLKNNKGSKLYPTDQSLEEKEGELATHPAKYQGGSNMPYWYKVLSRVEDKIVAFEDSDAVVIDYHWSFPQNELPSKFMIYKEKGAKGGFFEPYVNLYDRYTLERVQNATENTIPFAFATEEKLTNYPFFKPEEKDVLWKADGSDINNAASKLGMNWDYHAGVNPMICAKAVMDGDLLNVKEGEYKAKLKYTLPSILPKNSNSNSVSSHSNAQFLVRIDSKIDAYVSNYRSGKYSRRAGNVIVSFEWKADNEQCRLFKKVYENKTDVENKPMLFNSTYNERLDESKQFFLEDNLLSLPLKKENELQWTIGLDVQGLDMGMIGKSCTIEGKIDASFIRICWAPPKLKFQ